VFGRSKCSFDNGGAGSAFFVIGATVSAGARAEANANSTQVSRIEGGIGVLNRLLSHRSAISTLSSARQRATYSSLKRSAAIGVVYLPGSCITPFLWKRSSVSRTAGSGLRPYAQRSCQQRGPEWFDPLYAGERGIAAHPAFALSPICALPSAAYRREARPWLQPRITTSREKLSGAQNAKLFKILWATLWRLP
jgi:hypothetical protein